MYNILWNCIKLDIGEGKCSLKTSIKEQYWVGLGHSSKHTLIEQSSETCVVRKYYCSVDKIYPQFADKLSTYKHHNSTINNSISSSQVHKRYSREVL